MLNDKPLTTAEIAQHCHVTNRAVLKWIETGKIKAYRTPGSHARINVDDFIAFLKTYHFPIPPAYQHRLAHRRILIVDDDRELAGMIKRIMQLQKVFEVDVAHDGFLAGKKFAEFKPDLILLDIMMPKLDGFGVLAMLRQDSNNQHTKVICVSGADDNQLQEAKAKGADDVLAKPFDHKVLLLKIRHLLGMTLSES